MSSKRKHKEAGAYVQNKERGMEAFPNFLGSVSLMKAVICY